MKKIIIAGAGHGGLTAGAHLAKNGYDVTVYEKRAKSELGHDWEDRFTFDLLTKITGKSLGEFPENSWRYRGDCVFVSPAKRKRVNVKYTAETRQKIMWRKPLINMLLENAENAGVKFEFGTEITKPIIEGSTVKGLETSAGAVYGDLVIDAAGAFSPVRSNLPESLGIERMPKHGDLFYAYRAYYNRDELYDIPSEPFEVYMYHEGEKGLSWFCTNEKTCDVLIGRIDKLTDEKVKEQLAIFKKDHPWLGDEIINGGSYGIIPVRRPLTLMVADGYAALGDSAFMTMPMNGMGIDLSLYAGMLLAETVIKSGGDMSKRALWNYNAEFHRLYGGDASKNEGLKNAILSLPSSGVDFLFESEVIQSGDLAGAGRNTKLSALLGKFVRGMKQPSSFFTLLGGLIKGGKASKLYKAAPQVFDESAVKAWSDKIAALDIKL